MAHRYWRLRWYGSVNQGFRNGCHEIELRASAGGADETGSGTASADSIWSGSAANAFDDDTGTVCQMNSFNDGWIKYDFGASNDKAITEVSMRCNDLDMGPSNLRIEGSDDDVSWTPYHVARGLTWSNNETKVFTFGPLEPPLRITSLGNKSITVAGVFIHPSASQESVQWQLEDETGDFSTPLVDSGEVTSGDLLTRTFAALDPETVYQVRCRMKEAGDSTLGEWGYLYVRTPQWGGASREDFDPADLGGSPTGWTGSTTVYNIDDETIWADSSTHPRWNSDLSRGVMLRTDNNATWSVAAYPLQWANGPSIRNQRIVALVEAIGGNCEIVIGGRWTGSGHWYALHINTSLSEIRRGLGGAQIDTGAGISAGVRYWVVLEMEEDQIQAKFWALGTAEPAGFSLSATDANHDDAGDGWVDGDRVASSGVPSWDHLQVEFTEAQVPIPPTVTVDAVSETAADFSTDAFAGGTGVHQDTRWQVARDAAFTDLVEDIISAVDLEAHSINGLDSGEDFWVRAAFRDNAPAAGDFSAGVMFSTGSNPGVGDPPEVTVTDVKSTEISVGVELDPLFLDVEFRIQQGTTTIQSIVKSGAGRFDHTFELLTISTTYSLSARVTRVGGVSPWSTGVEATTLASDPDPADLLGCPPDLVGHLWNPDANPVDWQTRRGTGFYVPYAGQPLRGIATCILRRRASGGSWDIEISDDLGATYAPVVLDVTQGGFDGDGLQTYQFALDTTLYADGQDYRLKATAGSTVVESLSFCIDNAGLMSEWTNRDDLLPNGRYATLWWERKGELQWGGEATGEKCWYQASIERSLISYRGHGISAFVDQEVAQSLGGDVTIRFYLYDGEGGLFHQQARLDFEGWMAGIGFMVAGSSKEIIPGSDQTAGFEPPPGATGLFVGLRNDHSTALGCCDEFIVSTQGTSLGAQGRPTASDVWDGQLVEGDEFANSGLIKVLEKVHGKHSGGLFKFLAGSIKALFVDRFMWWREGNLPGNTPRKAATCGRRYEMVVLRARVEVDAGDKTRLRIRTRVDHAGIEPPASGYWHYDEWHTSPNEWTEGVLAIVGGQHARTLYGDANGSRTYVGYSMLPLAATVPPELPPVEVPIEVLLTAEGAPCTLILQAYDEDRENLKWEVGTDRDHPNPFLVEPEHYGEQEIDIIEGAATISQVDVIVIDKAQLAGDQDSGWMTERLVEDGVGVVQGRRFRLIRYVSVEVGWVVIADGPASVPRLDSSYAAYRWTIRDTRDTERRIQAFIETTTTNLLPMGVEAGFGLSIDPSTGDEFWVIEPNEPILGQFFYQFSEPGVPASGYVDFGTHWSGNYHFALGLLPEQQEVAPELSITEDVFNAGVADIETTDGQRPVFYTWPTIEVLWRPQGSVDPYNVVQVSDTLHATRRIAVPRGTPTDPDESSRGVFYGRNIFRAFSGQQTETFKKDIDRAVRWLFLQGVDESGNLKTDYVYPTEGQLVEVLVRYKGRPTKFAPLHIEFKETISYLYLPQEKGDLAYTLDHPNIDVTGSISLQARIAPVDWTVSQAVGGKYLTEGGYYLAVKKGGFLQFTYADETGKQHDVLSTEAVNYSPSTESWIRADLDATTAIVTFYVSGDALAWTRIGEPVAVFGVTAPTAIRSIAERLWLGVAIDGLPGINGQLFEFKIFDGTLLAYHADFTQFSTPVLSFPDSVGGLTVVIQQSAGDEAVAEMRITGVRYTTGELLRDLYDGIYSPRDSVTGDIIDSGIRYDEGALLQMRDPVRMRITDTIKDVRDWSEKNVYAPTGWIPALDNDARISPVSQTPPTDFTTLPTVDDPKTEAVPNWDAGQIAVNILNFKYPRIFLAAPEDADSADRLMIKPVEIEFRDEDAISNAGEQRADFDTEVFLANGDPTGSPHIDLTLEVGWQLSQERKLYVFDRYRRGAQSVHVPVMREFSATWRVGDWVVVDLSWIPDYVLKRRGGIFGGQIIAIRDVDCAWRVVLVEEALPVVVS